MNRGEAVAIELMADSSGKWPLHRHMLEHGFGMTTWCATARRASDQLIRVAATSTLHILRNRNPSQA
jgi:hypothetical protein